MTNYQSAKLRIKKANTIEDLNKLMISFDRVYNVGQLTINEFIKLDNYIMDKLIILIESEII